MSSADNMTSRVITGLRALSEPGVHSDEGV